MWVEKRIGPCIVGRSGYWVRELITQPRTSKYSPALCLYTLPFILVVSQNPLAGGLCVCGGERVRGSTNSSSTINVFLLKWESIQFNNILYLSDSFHRLLEIKPNFQSVGWYDGGKNNWKRESWHRVSTKAWCKNRRPATSEWKTSGRWRVQKRAPHKV